MQYMRVPGDDISHNTKVPDDDISYSPPAKSRRKVYISVLLSIIGTVMVVLVFTSSHVWPWGSVSRWTNCGSSAYEARERGCHFDTISFAWQTKECYDAEVVEAFQQYDDWEYWEMGKGGALWPISEEKAFRGERTVYVKEHYHKVHCTVSPHRLPSEMRVFLLTTVV
jgi:hypothetical protein